MKMQIKINNKVFSGVPRLHYNVPPCPECGSRKTGRYVRRPFFEKDALYMERESFRNGELIRMVDRVPVKNAYCEDCGHEWAQQINLSFFNREEVEEEKRERDTTEKYLKTEEEYRKQKKGLLGIAAGLFGKTTTR